MIPHRSQKFINDMIVDYKFKHSTTSDTTITLPQKLKDSLNNLHDYMLPLNIFTKNGGKVDEKINDTTEMTTEMTTEQTKFIERLTRITLKQLLNAYKNMNLKVFLFENLQPITINDAVKLANNIKQYLYEYEIRKTIKLNELIEDNYVDTLIICNNVDEAYDFKTNIHYLSDPKRTIYIDKPRSTERKSDIYGYFGTEEVDEILKEHKFKYIITGTCIPDIFMEIDGTPKKKFIESIKKYLVDGGSWIIYNIGRGTDSKRGGRTHRKQFKSIQNKSIKNKSIQNKSNRNKPHYKLPDVPLGTKFQKGPGRYKYTAILPNNKRVNFGHRDYQHYRDRVPMRMGGKLWSHLDHNDRERMENYRARHRGVSTKSGTPAYKKKYSPSWFSYHYLW